MNSYRFIDTGKFGGPAMLQRIGDNAFIPPSQENPDCRRFLTEWRDGTSSVTGADGSALEYSDDAVRALGLTPL